jgi:hypothetical protein
MELLQRWILVHSFIYYELNKNIISDEMFDKNSKQLYEMQQKHKAQFKKSRYYYAMHDFDGSTGNGFIEKLNEYDYDCVIRDAYILVQK